MILFCFVAACIGRQHGGVGGGARAAAGGGVGGRLPGAAGQAHAPPAARQPAQT